MMTDQPEPPATRDLRHILLASLRTLGECRPDADLHVNDYQADRSLPVVFLHDSRQVGTAALAIAARPRVENALGG